MKKTTFTVEEVMDILKKYRPPHLTNPFNSYFSGYECAWMNIVMELEKLIPEEQMDEWKEYMEI